MEKIKRLSAYAPVLAVILVAACIIGSLRGYAVPVYAEEDGDAVVEEMNTEEEPEAVKGSFNLEDGVYEGTGTGFAGKITVAVEIKDKTIVAINVLSVEADDTAFFNRARGVIDKIIESQSLDVDVVSGATYSSKGIIRAVKNALTGETDSGEIAAAGATSSAAGSKTVSAAEDPKAYKDGTYYGTGTGFAGPLTVKVVVNGGKIASIDITNTTDGSTFISKASSLISNIISTQSTNVDTVSGATYSSVGIIEAVRDALKQAAITDSDANVSSGNNGGQDQNPSQPGSSGSVVTGTIPYNEGIYYGTAEGYLGDITVAVVIQDHTIKAILITKTEDDEAFLSRAKAVAENVVARQDTNVDLVSGATYSSRGILDAIKQALQEAENVTNGITPGDKPGSDPEGDDPDENQPGNKPGDNPEGDDSGENHPGEDTPDVEEGIVYINGDYTAVVICEPDEYGDFEAYNLALKITVRSDRIVEVADITGDGDSGNERYINLAIKGRSGKPGVVTQILEKNSLDDIDVVSGATCTSDAMIEACRQALENAKR